MRQWLASIAVVLGACAADEAVQTADASSYSDLNKCWKREGRFRSFVILHNENRKYFPYFVSPWCDVIVNDVPAGAGFIPYINALKFSGDGGLLMNALLLDKPLQATTPSHTPLPSEGDTVYIFVGSVAPRENDGFIFYEITNAETFRRTDLVLKDLFLMNPEARLRQFQNLVG